MQMVIVNEAERRRNREEEIAERERAEKKRLEGVYRKWEDVQGNLKTKTQLGQLGLKLRKNQKPAAKIRAYKLHKYVEYDLYDINEAIPKKKVTKKEPVSLPLTPENIALALYTINKAAKRRRDGAENAYESGIRRLIKMHEKEKFKLYELKDRVMQKAIAEGAATFVGVHIQTRQVEKRVYDEDIDYLGDNDEEYWCGSCDYETREEKTYLGCYIMSGFRFHTILRDIPEVSDTEITDLGDWVSEATPQGRIKIKDAVATLEKYLVGEDLLT